MRLRLFRVICVNSVDYLISAVEDVRRGEEGFFYDSRRSEGVVSGGRGVNPQHQKEKTSKVCTGRKTPDEYFLEVIDSPRGRWAEVHSNRQTEADHVLSTISSAPRSNSASCPPPSPWRFPFTLCSQHSHRSASLLTPDPCISPPP